MEWKAKYPFELQSENYIIRIASEKEDIQKAQKLRHLTFIEQGLGKTIEGGLDFDEFDELADHLIIFDKATDQTVGTYRLISSQHSPKFYSQTEFVLDDFISTPGHKLEMGRACTHPDYRTGRTIDLLWQGLSEYIRRSQTQYLFGCSTVKTNDPQIMFQLHKSLWSKEKVLDIYNIRPTEDFYWPDSESLFESATPKTGITKDLPPLLRSYIHAGSFVHGLPAFDKDFDCFDLLTILDITTLNSKFKTRYSL